MLAGSSPARGARSSLYGVGAPPQRPCSVDFATAHELKAALAPKTTAASLGCRLPAPLFELPAFAEGFGEV